MTHIVFATAGLGTQEFQLAAKRVYWQLDKFSCSKEVIVLQDENLQQLCPTVAENFSIFLNSDTRGYGFMSWKAELTYRTLLKSRGKSPFFWVDAGCEVSFNFISKFKMRMLSKRLIRDGYLFFTLDTPERDYTKASLFTKFPTLDPNDDTPQAQTTFYGLYGDIGLKIAEKWFNVVASEISTVDEENNVSSFGNSVTHRHDQSVFSLVLKELGLKPNMSPLKADQSRFKVLRFIKYLTEPVIAARNRTGISKNPFDH